MPGTQQVYRVVHEGVVKAAKVTNLQRLGLGEKDLDRVFGRFVKELYILSQMHSERCDSISWHIFLFFLAFWQDNLESNTHD